MPKLYLLRHAESIANATRWKVCDVDTDLSEKGIEQAKQVTGEFDLVLVSPMKRARRTVELSQIKYKEIRVVHDAREQRYTITDLLEGEDYKIPESKEAMAERVKNLKKELREEVSTGKKILLATHSVLIRVLTSSDPVTRQGGIRVQNAEIVPFDL